MDASGNAIREMFQRINDFQPINRKWSIANEMK